MGKMNFYFSLPLSLLFHPSSTSLATNCEVVELKRRMNAELSSTHQPTPSTHSLFPNFFGKKNKQFKYKGGRGEERKGEVEGGSELNAPMGPLAKGHKIEPSLLFLLLLLLLLLFFFFLLFLFPPSYFHRIRESNWKKEGGKRKRAKKKDGNNLLPAKKNLYGRLNVVSREILLKFLSFLP